MRYYTTFLIAMTLAFLAVSTGNAVELGKIMPLGDSITAGHAPNGGIPGGYRQELYDNLTASGYSFQFVGSQTTYPSDALTAADQHHHEGHNSYTIQQIMDGVQNSNWLSVDPDIILLHIGANDMLTSEASTAPDRLDALIGSILLLKPSAKVIVAKIIGGSTVENDPNAAAYDAGIVAYNTAIAMKVNARMQLGQPVSLVDMYSLMNIHRQTDGFGNPLFADTSHPNQAGYDLMGDAWAGAIKAVAAPEPGGIYLLISGLLGLLAYAWRRCK